MISACKQLLEASGGRGWGEFRAGLKVAEGSLHALIQGRPPRLAPAHERPEGRGPKVAGSCKKKIKFFFPQHEADSFPMEEL